MVKGLAEKDLRGKIIINFSQHVFREMSQLEHLRWKTARYTDKSNPVDTQYRDVYKVVDSLLHYTNQNLAQGSKKGAHKNWVNNWLNKGSQNLLAKQKPWLSSCASLVGSEHQLVAGSSVLCTVDCSETASGQPHCGWAHTAGWGCAQQGCAVGQIPVPWEQL